MVREQAGFNNQKPLFSERPNARAFVATVNEAHFAARSFS
jgi:hypothetical protein